MPLIKASELRKKYFNEEIFTDATFEQLKTLCEKSIIDAAAYTDEEMQTEEFKLANSFFKISEM